MIIVTAARREMTVVLCAGRRGMARPIPLAGRATDDATFRVQVLLRGFRLTSVVRWRRRHRLISRSAHHAVSVARSVGWLHGVL